MSNGEYNSKRNIDDLLDPLRKEPIFSISTKAETGDPLAEFIYGELLISSGNAQEKKSGLIKMAEAVDAVQKRFAGGELSAEATCEILTSAADRIIEQIDELPESMKEYAEKQVFQMYSNAYELDTDRSDGLIRCYQNGIGCTRDMDRAMQMKEKIANDGNMLACAEISAYKYRQGLSVESITWAQKALGCNDSYRYPKLCSYLRMMLAKFGQTDHKGERLDYDIEKAGYLDTQCSDTHEGYVLFLLTDSEEEKDRFARDIEDFYPDAKDYINKKNRDAEQALQENEAEPDPNPPVPEETHKTADAPTVHKPAKRKISKKSLIAIAIVVVLFGSSPIARMVSTIRYNSRPVYYVVGNLDIAGIPISYDSYTATYTVSASSENITNDIEKPSDVDEADWKNLLSCIYYEVSDEAGEMENHPLTEDADVKISYSIDQRNLEVKEFMEKYKCRVETNADNPESQTVTLKLSDMLVDEPDEIPAALIDAAVFHANNDVKRDYGDAFKEVNKTNLITIECIEEHSLAFFCG